MVTGSQFPTYTQGSRTAWPLRPPVAGTNRLQRPQIPRLNFFYYASLCSQRNTNSTGHEPTPVGTKSQKWNLLCVYLCSFIGKNKHQTSLEANKIKTRLITSFFWLIESTILCSKNVDSDFCNAHNFVNFYLF